MNDKEWIELDLRILNELKSAINNFRHHVSREINFTHDNQRFTRSINFYYTDEMHNKTNATGTMIKLCNRASIELDKQIDVLKARKEEMEKKTYTVMFTYQDIIAVSIKSGFKTNSEALAYIWGLDDDSKQFLSVV